MEGRPTDLMAADLPRLAPAPWPDARPVVTLALQYLRSVADDDAAAIIEHLLYALADIRAERNALRDSVAAALDVARRAQTEAAHIRERYHAVLDAQRAAQARRAA